MYGLYFVILGINRLQSMHILPS